MEVDKPMHPDRAGQEDLPNLIPHSEAAVDHILVEAVDHIPVEVVDRIPVEVVVHITDKLYN
jgi:hypothetical protein